MRRPSRIFSQAERLEHLEQLWATTIVHRDVVIAGNGASDALPAAGPWFVVPCDDDEFAHLDRVLGGLERAEVVVGSDATHAALTDRMAPSTAARVGLAFGASTIWHLERDSVRSISTDPAIVIDGDQPGDVGWRRDHGACPISTPSRSSTSIAVNLLHPSGGLAGRSLRNLTPLGYRRHVRSELMRDRL